MACRHLPAAWWRVGTDRQRTTGGQPPAGPRACSSRVSASAAVLTAGPIRRISSLPFQPEMDRAATGCPSGAKMGLAAQPTPVTGFLVLVSDPGFLDPPQFAQEQPRRGDRPWSHWPEPAVDDGLHHRVRGKREQRLADRRGMGGQSSTDLGRHPGCIAAADDLDVHHLLVHQHGQMHGLPADLAQVRHVRKSDLTEFALQGSQFTQLEQFRAELEVAAVGPFQEAVLGQLGGQSGGRGLRQTRSPGQFGDPHRQVPGVERAEQGRGSPHHGVESVPFTGTHGLMMTVTVRTLQGPFVLQKRRARPPAWQTVPQIGADQMPAGSIRIDRHLADRPGVAVAEARLAALSP